MKIGKQVTSLELSKKLKELGVKQESLFSWFYDEEDKDNQGIAFDIQYSDASTYDEDKWICSAFTVAELGELLPMGAKSFVSSHGRNVKKWVTEWSGIPLEWDRSEQKFAHTEADARAKMLIYLIEHELVKTPLVKPSV